MNKQNTTYYITDEQSGIELVLCRDSFKSYPLHNHVSVYTIGYVLNGMLELQTNTDTQKYEKGSYFLLKPYSPHALNALTPYSMLSICIPKSAFAQMPSSAIYTNITKLLCHTGLFDAAQEKQLFPVIHALIGNIASHALLPLSANNIIAQLELYPEEKISIDEMAQRTHISKYQFIRNFKRDVGLTPHQFQIQNQVRKAQKSLNQVKNITEVALDSGFFDQSHFIKHFKKIVQLTPSEYQLCCKTITDPPV